MSKPGLFLHKYFLNKEIEIWTSNEDEVVKYESTDNYTWCVIKGIVVGYDDETGILILSNPKGDLFYLNDFKIESFWAPGTDIRDFTRSTGHGRRPNKKDFM